MNKDSLSDRMKRYEKVSSPSLYRKMPVICRVDGRAFHTYAKKFVRPYDVRLIKSMAGAATKLAEEMQGFKLAYVQSDEASFLLTDYETHETQPWFDNDMSKIVSLAASLMSVYFNDEIKGRLGPPINKLAVFDARAFNLPREEVANYFLFRAKDWQRNSLQMYARSVFSHKELNGKKQEDMHNMLYEKGKNWTTDLSPQEKNGTFLVKDGREIKQVINILPDYESVNDVVKTFV